MEKKELPPGTILKVLDRMNIPYKRVGKNYQLRCPFHDDKNPSATVNTEKNTFLCFACGSSLYRKWAEKKGIKSYKEKKALPAKALAQMLGMKESQWKEVVKEAFKEYEEKGQITVKEGVIKKEGKKKKINHEDIWKKAIGVWNEEAARYLEKRKLDPEKLLKQNEIRFLTSGISKITDRYLEWPIMVPMYSMDGKKIVNIQLRSAGNKTPKSIMIPGGEITHFGLQDLQKGNLIAFITEGSTDYLTLKSWGFKNAIGLYSASKGVEKELIQRLPKIIIVFYDHDMAGIKMFKNLKEEILDHDSSKIIVPFGIKGKSKDLNEFAVNNPDAEKVIIKSIKDFLKNTLKDSPSKEKLLSNFEKIIKR